MSVESSLASALRAGRFVVVAEVDPPPRADPESLRQKVRALRGQVAAVSLTDNPRATARMSSLAAAVIALQEGVEPVMQVSCRDRNRLAIVADVLGASSLGIRNVLVVTGDHTALGDQPGTRPVFDLDPIQVVQLLRSLRDEGKLSSGDEEEGNRLCLVGTDESPFADPFGEKAIRLAKKVRAGAELVQTTVVRDVPKLAEWMKLVRERGLHEQVSILAGVGVDGSANGARQEGLRAAAETIQRIREIPGVAGVRVVAPGGEEAISEIAAKAGL